MKRVLMSAVAMFVVGCAQPAQDTETVVEFGSIFCNTEELLMAAIDQRLSDPAAPLIRGCWIVGSLAPARELGHGVLEQFVRIDLDGVGEGWVERDALRTRTAS